MLFAIEWERTLDALFKLLGPVAGVLIGWFWGQWRAQSAWKKKEFKSSMVLSLNMLKLYEQPEEGGTIGSLKLRTLFERDLSTLFPNRAMKKMVRDAGDATTKEDPLLRFPKEDAWYLLNSILNQISEQFAAGVLRADLGGEVLRGWYTFCVTFERDEKLHQFKPRILLIARDDFLNLPMEGDFDLESPQHKTRIDTLRLLRREYEKYPYLFMDLELTL